MSERVRAYLVSAAFIALVVAPAFRNADDDGFPLSTYPMFAHAKARVSDVTGAFAVHASGARSTLSPSFVANSEPMLAVAMLRRTLAAGPAASKALCATIAARVAQSNEAELADAQRVEIATRRVDAIDFLAGRATSDERGQVHVSCKVPRGAQAAAERERPGAAR